MNPEPTLPASKKKLAVGERAPDFTLTAAGGKTVRLADVLAQKAVVLFFYPKDETPGCTAEACEFRDQYECFVEAGAEVLGVSDDDVESHARFAARHRLPMPLLSDPGGRVRRAFGVNPTFGILPGRVTFVIDRGGVIRYVFESQLRVTQHVTRALEIVREIAGKPG